ncbi:MAG: helix-turn-helix domain-containing protein [Pirellulales bacterium]|nr:helix-turn-helix domain-containing protein [Pirellulales bacterium]
MARKLIDQDEAARILGVSADEVGSLRDRKKLFPYRDGDQWKFKQEDVERLRDDMQAEKSNGGVTWENPSDSSAGDSEEIELQMSDDLDSILLSEIELGKSGTEGPSTIIGKGDKGAISEDDDFNIITDDKSAAHAPDVTLASSSGLSFGTGTGSGLGDSGLNLGGSDVQLAATGSELTKKASSSDKLFGSDALKLSDDELSLVAPSKPGDSSKKGLGSAVNLAEEDSESALGASSDVTLSPSDSGIHLISASDSGLSLEEPVALGSSAKKLLELSDEDVISLEESPAGSSVAIAGEKADDEFLLTAVDETTGDESDSGSQVIALDADDELSSGMFAPVASTTMLEEDSSAGAALGTPAAGASPLLGAAPVSVAAGSEAPFTTMNVLALFTCVVLLLVCGMMAYDLMRNMWSWNGPIELNSSILNAFGSMLPGK